MKKLKTFDELILSIHDEIRIKQEQDNKKGYNEF